MLGTQAMLRFPAPAALTLASSLHSPLLWCTLLRIKKVEQNSEHAIKGVL